MTTSIHRESAKIYQFPTRVRPPVGGQFDEAKRGADSVPPALANAIYGSSWYHEAAVLAADRAVKR